MERRETRKAVIGAILAFMRDSKAKGLDPWSEAMKRYPDVPSVLVTEAHCALLDEEEEEFLDAVNDQVSRAMDAIAIS